MYDLLGGHKYVTCLCQRVFIRSPLALECCMPPCGARKLYVQPIFHQSDTVLRKLHLACSLQSHSYRCKASCGRPQIFYQWICYRPDSDVFYEIRRQRCSKSLNPQPWIWLILRALWQIGFCVLQGLPWRQLQGGEADAAVSQPHFSSIASANDHRCFWRRYVVSSIDCYLWIPDYEAIIHQPCLWLLFPFRSLK